MGWWAVSNQSWCSDVAGATPLVTAYIGAFRTGAVDWISLGAQRGRLYLNVVCSHRMSSALSKGHSGDMFSLKFICIHWADTVVGIEYRLCNGQPLLVTSDIIWDRKWVKNKIYLHDVCSAKGSFSWHVFSLKVICTHKPSPLCVWNSAYVTPTLFFIFYFLSDIISDW